jgi:hypothetical protein
MSPESAIAWKIGSCVIDSIYNADILPSVDVLDFIGKWMRGRIVK